jgi:hypothetical protein
MPKIEACLPNVALCREGMSHREECLTMRLVFTAVPLAGVANSKFA